jgi:hypothetical protein
VVQERQSSDQVLLNSRHKILGVVAEELHGCEHSKPPVVKLLVLSLLELLLALALRLSELEVAQKAVVVNGTDQEDHLQPAESRHSLDGSNAVGDGLKGDARSNVSGEFKNFWHDVPKYGQLGNASVLELRSAVLVKGSLVDILGQALITAEARILRVKM